MGLWGMDSDPLLRPCNMDHGNKALWLISNSMFFPETSRSTFLSLLALPTGPDMEDAADATGIKSEGGFLKVSFQQRFGSCGQGQREKVGCGSTEVPFVWHREAFGKESGIVGSSAGGCSLRKHQ